jgi:hypothetical protein
LTSIGNLTQGRHSVRRMPGRRGYKGGEPFVSWLQSTRCVCTLNRELQTLMQEGSPFQGTDEAVPSN